MLLFLSELGIESACSNGTGSRCLISFHSAINMEDLGYLMAASVTLIALVSLYTYAWAQLAVTRSPPASNQRDTVVSIEADKRRKLSREFPIPPEIVYFLRAKFLPI